MTGVFREMSMQWNGVKYTLTPSMALMRRIDREVSIMDMIQRANENRFPVFDLSYVICEFLRAAGAKDVNDDQVYKDLMADMADNEGKETLPMLQAIITAVSPADEDGKKPEGRAVSKKAKAV